MTWKHTAWLLQWGPSGGVISRVTSRRVDSLTLSFHYPGGTPLWTVVKGRVYLRRWLGCSPRGGPQRGKWYTMLVTPLEAPRWAEKGTPHRGGINLAVRGVGGVFRPAGFDFSRWRFTLRGSAPGGWSTGVDPEQYLLRPRYV